MKVTALSPVGARLDDIDLQSLDVEAINDMQTLLAEHGVLVMGDQHLDDAQFVAFLRRFGELTFTTGETPVPGFADLNIVSNVGRAVPPRSTFHTDTSYVRVPPAYTALRAVVVPTGGGDTLFSNQYRALDTLTPEVRSFLGHRRITHVVTGLELGDDAETSAEHLVVRPHPRTGRPALFLSAVPRCVSLSGLDDVTARDVVQTLFDHSTDADNVMRHAWSAGDIVMWDNACVMHRADHDHVAGDRVFHRGMVAGR